MLDRYDLDPLRRAAMVKENGLPAVDEFTRIPRTNRQEGIMRLLSARLQPKPLTESPMTFLPFPRDDTGLFEG